MCPLHSPFYAAFDLTANGGVWATNRSSSPGYYSAIFDAFNNSTFTNGSNAHNVNGYVKRTGVGPFTFPVGTGTELRSLSMTGPTDPSVIATAWIPGDPNGPNDPTDFERWPSSKKSIRQWHPGC